MTSLGALDSDGLLRRQCDRRFYGSRHLHSGTRQGRRFSCASFTLASSPPLRGISLSQLLYSLHSIACVINPEYADPATFDQVFDIFSTQSKTSAHLINYQFGQLIPTNASITIYDSQRLNDTAEAVKDSIQKGYATEPGFLYAVLRAYNATGDVNDPVGTGGNGGSTDSGGSSSSNTALAM